MLVDVGVKVLVNRPGVVNERGTVVRVIDLDDNTVVLVTLDRGDTIKAFITDVTVIQEDAPKEAEKPEKTVTISKSQFREIVCEAIHDIAKRDIEMVEFLTLFCVYLSKKIFDKVDND